jgi:hypothetical protein
MYVNYKANQKKTTFVIVMVKLLPYCLGVAGGQNCPVLESKAGDI